MVRRVVEGNYQNAFLFCPHASVTLCFGAACRHPAQYSASLEARYPHMLQAKNKLRVQRGPIHLYRAATVCLTSPRKLVLSSTRSHVIASATVTEQLLNDFIVQISAWGVRSVGIIVLRSQSVDRAMIV